MSDSAERIERTIAMVCDALELGDDIAVQMRRHIRPLGIAGDVARFMVVLSIMLGLANAVSLAAVPWWLCAAPMAVAGVLVLVSAAAFFVLIIRAANRGGGHRG